VEDGAARKNRRGGGEGRGWVSGKNGEGVRRKNARDSLIVLSGLREHDKVVACLGSFVAVQPVQTKSERK